MSESESNSQSISEEGKMPTPAAIPITTKQGSPSWIDVLRLKFMARISHLFIITGNVRDLVDSRNTISKFLSKLFIMQGGQTPKYDIVIFYDRANGLTFALEDMKERFLRAVAGEALAASADQQRGIQSAFGAAVPSNLSLPREPIKAFEMVERVLEKERLDT